MAAAADLWLSIHGLCMILLFLLSERVADSQNVVRSIILVSKQPLKQVFDKDTFSYDDPMGNAEFDIHPFVEAVKMNLQDIPNGTVVTKVVPNRQNCLAEESTVYWSEGKVIQDLALRLRNVECGEVELQLQWVNIPGSRGF